MVLNELSLDDLTCSLDISEVRHDFPILNNKVNGKPLVYLDNASTTQKPSVVLNALDYHYTNENANIHRGVHDLSQKATIAYEKARDRVGRFLNTSESDEIVFVRGATEAINLIAHSFGRQQINEGDEIIISQMEHHSNIVPWQVLCKEKKAVLRIIPINSKGELLFDDYINLLNPNTKIVSISHASNVLGTINPIKEITARAHAVGAVVVIDGAQGVPHLEVDVTSINCDFYTFSGHKLFAPTGIGVLYGKKHLLEEMAPWETGGSMITKVSLEEGTTYASVPTKFEAGTPSIAGAISLAAAIDYVENLGLDVIEKYERDLLKYGEQLLSEIPGLHIFGQADEKVGVISFALESIHPHDIGTILDTEGIAVRAGHHCAQPLMDFYNVPAMARASIAFYNSHVEMELLASSIEKVRRVFN
mgnify:FL=1